MRLQFQFLPKVLLVSIFLTGLAAPPLNAQDTTQTGWSVSQSCVDKVVEPPNGWKFPGAILLDTFPNITVLQSDSAASKTIEIPAKNRLIDEALSPDLAWLATLGGKNNADPDTGDSTYTIDHIYVYSTSDPKQTYTLPWQNAYSEGEDSSGQRQLRWIDKTHLVYETKVDTSSEVSMDNVIIVNPFTGDAAKWEGTLNPLMSHESFYPDPNWSRAVSDKVFDYWSIYDIQTGNKIASFPKLSTMTAAWKPDGQQFAAFPEEGYSPLSLVLMDKDGQLLDQILVLNKGEGIRGTLAYPNMVWSPDGRYLAISTYAVETPNLNQNNLYIVDTQDKAVLNLCQVNDQGMAWSPDSTLLSFYMNPDAPNLAVYDVNTKQAYKLSSIMGNVMGWRNEE